MEDNHANPGGAAHGSLRQYTIGLILSIVLTAIPFGLVMTGVQASLMVFTLIILCAIAQIFVQLVFFLHMSMESEQIWNTTSAVFIVLIVAILVLGSIWIMQHLNHNMLMGH